MDSRSGLGWEKPPTFWLLKCSSDYQWMGLSQQSVHGDGDTRMRCQRQSCDDGVGLRPSRTRVHAFLFSLGSSRFLLLDLSPAPGQSGPLSSQALMPLQRTCSKCPLPAASAGTEPGFWGGAAHLRSRALGGSLTHARV